MARPSLQSVQTLANTDFADNNTGAITPQKLREWIAKMIEAIRPAYAYLSRVAATVQPITTVAAPVVFDTGVRSPIGELEYAISLLGAGNPNTISRVDPGTTRFTFTADILPAVNTNLTLTFTLMKNGSATPWKQSLTMSSNTITESISFAAIEYLNAAAVYRMDVQSTANVNITFSNMTLVAESVPIWEYI